MTENNEYTEIKQHVGESFLIEGLTFSVGWYKNPLTTKEEDNAIMVKCMDDDICFLEYPKDSLKKIIDKITSVLKDIKANKANGVSTQDYIRCTTCLKNLQHNIKLMEYTLKGLTIEINKMWDVFQNREGEK